MSEQYILIKTREYFDFYTAVGFEVTTRSNYNTYIANIKKYLESDIENTVITTWDIDHQPNIYECIEDLLKTITVVDISEDEYNTFIKLDFKYFGHTSPLDIEVLF